MQHKNKWFSDVFLQSVFESVGTGKQKWLTAKQTAICINNMDKNTVVFDYDGYGTMCKHDNYSCDWNGRKVYLSYSKKNGCGCIQFGYNAEESAAFQAEHEAEKAKIKAERIERIKRNPERLERKVAQLTRDIQNAKKQYEYDIGDNETELAKEDLIYIEELERELALYID